MNDRDVNDVSKISKCLMKLSISIEISYNKNFDIREVLYKYTMLKKYILVLYLIGIDSIPNKYIRYLLQVGSFERP